jgi:hypothetical protein
LKTLLNSTNPYFPPNHAADQASADGASLVARLFATFLVGVALLSAFVGAFGVYSELRGDGFHAPDISALALLFSVALLWPFAAFRFWSSRARKWRLVLGPMVPTLVTIMVLLFAGRA